MAAHAVEITMTEDMIEAMMIGTITADRTEEEEEEEDGELHWETKKLCASIVISLFL